MSHCPSLTDPDPSAVLDRVSEAARRAFPVLRAAPPARRATLLRTIGERLAARREPLLRAAAEESRLDASRLAGEFQRTVNQLGMLADTIQEGSWIDARIDRAKPARSPVPKPDLRRMLVPIGPVAVFGASNFPIAFSSAGGDTASALGCGCPVLFRGHPAHPHTASEAAAAIAEAVEGCGFPAGVFGLAPGTSHADGLALVRHPAVRAVAFTGSARGGRALLEAANTRPDPIPVFAEMGSLNPLVLLPSSLAADPESRADAFFASMTLGAGQFCTKPGLVVSLAGSPLERFVARLAEHVASAAPMPMVYDDLCEGYAASCSRAAALPGVQRLVSQARSEATARAAVLRLSARRFIETPALQEEIFGPAALVVEAADTGELQQVLEALGGQLTGTVHATEEELEQQPEVLTLLAERAGRVIVNGFPTGVEVCPSMQHGGPYPATSDARSTSVGTAALYRFVRPVCFQNVPERCLPAELLAANPLRIWRLVDGERTQGPLE